MEDPGAAQIEFGFDQPRETDGYCIWARQREEEMREMGRRLGLPLGHPVEVWLKDGTLLKGRLLLRGEEKDWEFVIGRVGFKATEIESCIRLD